MQLHIPQWSWTPLKLALEEMGRKMNARLGVFAEGSCGTAVVAAVAPVQDQPRRADKKEAPNETTWRKKGSEEEIGNQAPPWPPAAPDRNP